MDSFYVFFFFNDTATTEIYTSIDTLSLHDALPISAVDETPSPAAPPMRKTRSLLAIRNPTAWAEVCLGFPLQRRPNLIYSCMYRTRRTTRSRHNPFGRRDVPDANVVRAVPDLPKHPKPLG